MKYLPGGPHSPSAAQRQQQEWSAKGAAAASGLPAAANMQAYYDNVSKGALGSGHHSRQQETHTISKSTPFKPDWN